MKTKKILIVLAIIAGFVISFNTVCEVLDTFFFSIEDLPTGKLIERVDSPDGKCAVSVYYVENALGSAVRCSVDNGEGEKNIYWNTEDSSASVRFIDNKNVVINDVTLNVENGSYDSRMVNEELDLFLKTKQIF